jgi:hypothetical protein
MAVDALVCSAKCIAIRSTADHAGVRLIISKKLAKPDPLDDIKISLYP